MAEKILVVDDHPLIQQALAQALPQLHGPLEVLAAIDRGQLHAGIIGLRTLALGPLRPLFARGQRLKRQRNAF